MTNDEELKKQLADLKKTLAALQQQIDTKKEERAEEDAVAEKQAEEEKARLEEELKKFHPGELILYALKKNLISRSKTD